MGETPRRVVVAPNFRTPRLLGIFNVVFASELLIVGLCMGGYTAVMPLFGRLMGASRSQLDAQAAVTRKARLDDVALREKDAKTEQERIDLAVERKGIEAEHGSPMDAMMEVNKAQMGNPAFLRYSWVDALSGIALNVLLLASGVGLLHWRPWARSLGVWTAGLKVVRLVLLYGYFVVAVVPPYARGLGKAVVSMMSAAGPGVKGAAFVTEESYAWIYTVMYSGMGLGVMVFGAVYPAVLLWLLTRPAVKSACSGVLVLPKEPKQPC